jgi:hypothetical protein
MRSIIEDGDMVCKNCNKALRADEVIKIDKGYAHNIIVRKIFITKKELCMGVQLKASVWEHICYTLGISWEMYNKLYVVLSAIHDNKKETK